MLIPPISPLLCLNPPRFFQVGRGNNLKTFYTPHPLFIIKRGERCFIFLSQAGLTIKYPATESYLIIFIKLASADFEE
jgi:hypothetical protein